MKNFNQLFLVGLVLTLASCGSITSDKSYDNNNGNIHADSIGKDREEFERLREEARKKWQLTPVEISINLLRWEVAPLETFLNPLPSDPYFRNYTSEYREYINTDQPGWWISCDYCYVDLNLDFYQRAEKVQFYYQKQFEPLAFPKPRITTFYFGGVNGDMTGIRCGVDQFELLKEPTDPSSYAFTHQTKCSVQAMVGDKVTIYRSDLTAPINNGYTHTFEGIWRSPQTEDYNWYSQQDTFVTNYDSTNGKYEFIVPEKLAPNEAIFLHNGVKLVDGEHR